jgi:DNA (cytosine-5)-methyltransferase 1
MGAGEFKITVPLNKALFGFGDAVCVPAIEWIGRNYLNAVWERDYAWETPTEEPTKIQTYRSLRRA